MKIKIPKISLLLSSLYLTTFNFATAAPTEACLPTDVNCVTQVTSATSYAPADIINQVIDWVLLFAGAVAVLLIIYGGFVYVTSAGNEKRVETAKKILTYAIFGLIVIILAKVIVVFVKNAIYNPVTKGGVLNQPIK